MEERRNAPKLRFPGFTDPWEQRRLGEVASFNPQADLPNEFEYVDLESVVGTEMVSHRKESKLTAPSRAQRLARKGDIFYQTVRPYQKNNLLFELPDENYVFSTGYAQIRTEQDSRFLFCLLQREPFVRLVLDRCTGTSYPAISATDLETIDINLPSMSVEQARIGSLFQKLDSLIALHQRELDHVKELKKGLLQKMFPKEGANVPELRFPGFTDPWEQRRLGEIGSARSGVGFPNAEQGGSEGTPFYKVSDMNLEGNEFQLRRANNYVTDEQIERKRWKPINEVPAMFFAKVGAAVLLNRKRLVDEPFLLDNNTMAYSFNRRFWDVTFGRILFDGLDLTSLVQVGALPSYNASDIESMEVAIPLKIAEQTKIGALFQRLDSLIALHQRELDHVKELKKGLLQQMFV